MMGAFEECYKEKEKAIEMHRALYSTSETTNISVTQNLKFYSKRWCCSKRWRCKRSAKVVRKRIREVSILYFDVVVLPYTAQRLQVSEQKMVIR